MEGNYIQIASEIADRSLQNSSVLDRTAELLLADLQVEPPTVLIDEPGDRWDAQA